MARNGTQMSRLVGAALVVGLAGMAGNAIAGGRVVTFSGTAICGSNDGTIAFSTNTKFTVGAGSLTLTPMPGTSPSVSCTNADATFAGGTVSSAAARWSSATNTWTNCPLVATVTAIGNVRDISADGNYLVGQCTITGGFGGYVTDFSGPTPVTRKLLGNTATARACAVSNGGLVIVGGEAPNTSSGRPGVWRWNAGTSSYDWSYLPDGPSTGGVGTVGRSVDNFLINDAGTIIVGDSFKWDDDLAIVKHWLTKWVWNAGTSTWDRNDLYDIDGGTITLGSWWIPTSGCPIPPNIIPSGMSNDGNTIVGKADYQTCGSFYGGGFIYKSGVMYDFNDYLVAQGVDLVTPGYGPYSNSFGGFSHLGFALDVSDDGNHFIGNPYIDPDAPGAYQIDLGVTGSCVSPAISTNPTASTTFSACNSSIILSAAAVGSAPFTYQWNKNGSPISAGSTGNGTSQYQVLAGGKQLRIVGGPLLSPADAGSYTCTASNSCVGSGATTTAAVVAVDGTLVAINNDTCAGADANVVVMGTNTLGTAKTPCAAWTDGTEDQACLVNPPKLDRWYKFVPPTTQNYRFDTCGANYDTTLNLYDGCGGNPIACNNDYVTGPSTGCSSQRSRVSAIELTAGVPVYIRIGALSTASLSGTSTFNLSITAAPVIPSNDDCSSALSIPLGVTPFNTTEALAQPFLNALSCAASSNASRDVWFKYTADFNGLLSASTCPTGTAPSGYSLMTNTVLAFYDGGCGNVIACNDNLSPVPSGCGTSLSSITNFPVSSGQEVWIRVAGNNSTTFGAGQLTLSLTCPCVADFDNSGGTPDAGDIDAFFNAWLAGTASADADCSGGTPDSGDIDVFFNQWLAGGC